MKTTNRRFKLVFILSILMGLSSLIFAQTSINMDVSSGYGYVYLCDGTIYNITYTGSGSSGIKNFSWVQESGVSNYSPESYGTTLSEASGYESVAEVTFSNGFLAQVYFIGSKTGISGPNQLCVGNTPTYTVTTNETGATAYTWAVPSTMSGSCSGCGATHSVTVTGGGVGTLTVTANGCPTGSASNVVVSPPITSYSSAPAAPTYFNYVQTGHACLYSGTTSTVSGAMDYQWAYDPNFNSLYGTSTAPTIGGVFDPSTTYTIYVRGTNVCGPGQHLGPLVRTTPAPPKGCMERPIAPNAQSTDYKIYPNPATNQLNIEYPALNGNGICTVYDMLGNKVISWTLPEDGNKVNENTSALSPGIYMYIIKDNDNILNRGKLLIQK